MRRYSRMLAGFDLRLAGAVTLAAAWLVVLVAIAYSATTVAPPLKTVGAALLLLGIAITGILYAWREPGA